MSLFAIMGETASLDRDHAVLLGVYTLPRFSMFGEREGSFAAVLADDARLVTNIRINGITQNLKDPWPAVVRKPREH
jgi:hypothetical protein